ncbi:MAG: oligoendopeptidase F, partial [Anaerococcus hydrogenalis]|nr:oligoendopeptidase F [Anaerococcus hydrogenalis]
MVKRNEVDIKETWKLEDLFENDEKFYEELDKTIKASENFKKTYSQIDSSDKLYKALKDLSEIYGAMHRL